MFHRKIRSQPHTVADSGYHRHPEHHGRLRLHAETSHERLNNLTPADIYFGRGQTIQLERERIKRKTIKHRRLQHLDAAD